MMSELEGNTTMTDLVFAPKRMGCNDTGAPEVPVWVLRNIHEVLRFTEHYYGHASKMKYWEGLPADLRCEYNYANWEFYPSNKD